MNRPTTRAHVAALAAAASTLLLGACASGGATTTPTTGTGDLSSAEIEAIYRARTDSMRTRWTDADVRFMQGMIHHHAQAIEMSRLAPERAASASIRTLAARIINAQRDEIALMQRWLRDRDQQVPEVHVGDDHVMVEGGGHMHMPGMLTAEQMRSLAAASGEAFDRRFLELMIQHHNGAVTMVRELFATDGAGQDEEVFKFASDAHVDQATEVARMERMLAAMTGR